MSAPGAPQTAAARDYLHAYAARADARLSQLLEAREARLTALPFGLAAYHRQLREYVLRGGKRLRGALVLLGHRACGAGDDAPALDASVAFELLHAYLLAYDDIIDRDDLRRGGPALHVLAAREAALAGAREPAHRGLSVALLLGMLARGMAWDLIREAPLPPAGRLEALGWLAQVEEGVTIGQLLDVCAGDAPAAPPEALAEIRRRKTGLYTTEGPLVLGALLAGTPIDDPRVQALRAWARPAGEAFQLVDDVLSITADPRDTGKPALGDVREARRTAVIEEALRRAPAPRAATLRSLLGHAPDEAQTAQVRAILEDCGAVEAVRTRARELGAEAIGALRSAALEAGAVTILASLARLVVERRS